MYAEPVPLREARRRWAELLRRIFEIEPLACPRCGQTISLITYAAPQLQGTVPVPRPCEPRGFALQPVPVPTRE